MRFVFVAALLLVACSSSPAPVDLGPADMTADLSQTTSSLSPPNGFGTGCSMSGDCAGFAQDQPPGFLGCGSYLGVNYCTRPCDDTHLCWNGTSCTCVNRINAGGQAEHDCYCAKP